MDDDRRDLIQRLFALLTAWLEDDAALAVEGQGQRTPDEYRALADRIRSDADATICIADTIVMLLKWMGSGLAVDYIRVLSRC